MQYTENLNLPIYEPNDIPSWLVSVNETSRLIDTAYGNLESDVTLNKQDILLIQTSIANIGDSITALTSRVGTNETDITDLETAVGGLNTLVTSLNTAVTNLASRVTSVETQVGTRHNGVIGVGETTLTVSAPELTNDSLIDFYFGGNEAVTPTSWSSDIVGKTVTVSVPLRSSAINVSVVVK